MSHFAKVEDGVVTEVIVAEQDVIDSGLFGDPSLWVQTSYNTRLNLHHSPITGEKDNDPPLRGNFASVGYIYDSVNDVFYPPKPSTNPSWVLNTNNWIWQPPLPHPNDGVKTYIWDEATISWMEYIPVEAPPA